MTAEDRFRFRHEERVRWVDLDAAGVLNNAVHLTFLEQARHGYFGALGLLRGDGFPFLLGETRIRYLRPGRGGEVLAVAARVTRLGGKSLDMEFEVRSGPELVAVAVATLVWVDPAGRSTPIPDSARAAIADFEGERLGQSPAVFSDNSPDRGV